jgi:hypothetical protein
VTGDWEVVTSKGIGDRELRSLRGTVTIDGEEREVGVGPDGWVGVRFSPGLRELEAHEWHELEREAIAACDELLPVESLGWLRREIEHERRIRGVLTGREIAESVLDFARAHGVEVEPLDVQDDLEENGGPVTRPGTFAFWLGDHYCGVRQNLPDGTRRSWPSLCPGCGRPISRP